MHLTDVTDAEDRKEGNRRSTVVNPKVNNRKKKEKTDVVIRGSLKIHFKGRTYFTFTGVSICKAQGCKSDVVCLYQRLWEKSSTSVMAASIQVTENLDNVRCLQHILSSCVHAFFKITSHFGLYCIGRHIRRPRL